MQSQVNEKLLAEHEEVNTEIDQNILDHGFMSRGMAAKIFEDLSDIVGSGNMPDNVSPYAVGRAVERTLNNNGLGEAHNTSELLRGLFGLDEDQAKQVMRLIDEAQKENIGPFAETRDQISAV